MIDYSLINARDRGNTVTKPKADAATPNTLSSSVRTREYLTAAEIEKLIAAASGLCLTEES